MALAAHYPSVGGRPDHPWPAFVEVLRDHRDELRRLVEQPFQTNEPGRCAALLGGFLEVARLTGMPLRLLEVGASAGLNLRFDRYRYVLGDVAWGPPTAPVTIRTRLTAGTPPLDARLTITAQAGCDPGRQTRPARTAASPCCRTCGRTSSSDSSACGRRWKWPAWSPAGG